jgi:type IV secretory pathway TraG/TraD family ATPase VirD4
MIQIVNLIFGVILNLFEAIISSLIDLAVSLVPSKRKHEYDADFENLGKSLKRHNQNPGFYIGSYSTSSHAANSHMICIGGSGSFKSTNVSVPMLLQNHTCSYVVHDCAHELYDLTATAFYEDGFNVQAIDCSSQYTEGFNHFEKSRTLEAFNKNTSVLFDNCFQGESDYWRQSAESLGLFFGKALWLYAEPHHRNMANLINMITVFSYAPEKIDKWIVARNDAQFLSQYKSICSTPSRTLQCSLSTLKTGLSIYESQSIQKLTSFDSIDFESFRKQKTILYLCNTPATAHYYRSISATFIQCFFNHILENRPSSRDLNIMFLLDECSVLRLPTLSSFLSLSRKYQISVATLWQDLNQIDHSYGKYESANIFSNSNLKVFMPCSKPMETCIMLQNLCGKYHYTSEDGVLRTRELLTSHEIFQLEKILVLNGTDKPLLLEREPFFKFPHLQRQTQKPVHPLSSMLPQDPVPLIEF